MIAVISNAIKDFLNMEWLTGPFLDKELRVSSRHRRNYLLRAIYVLTLLFFVAITWVNIIENSRNMTFQRSRLAEMGRMITVTIVQFQFIATQVIAVILFCNSVSNEIYHRTLGVLLTTPVTSFQIVMGKLVSKLFQIILLIAISLPLLAIVRIFGGVSWSYILTSLCVTLVAVIFAGSLSLFFSVVFRQAYFVIILTMSILGFLYGLRNLDFVRFSRGISFNRYGYRSPSFSPFFIFEKIINYIRSPGQNIFNNELIIYSSLLLLISLILLLRSSHLLRKIALANAFGQKSFWKRMIRRIDIFCDKLFATKKIKPDEQIRHVWGPAVAWKEMRMKFSSREKMFVAIIISIELIMIIAMYLFPYIASEYGYDEALTLYLYVFMGFGVFSTVFFSVRCITSEKEAQTWCSLLMTPLSDWQIMSGKFVGILRRILPIWIMLFIYFCAFTNISGRGPLSLFLLTIMMIGIVAFLYGASLYFSSRFKNTSNAIIAIIILLSVIWLVFPVVIDSNIPRFYAQYFQFGPFNRSYMIINPFILTQTIMTTDLYTVRQYITWPDQTRDYLSSFILMTNIVFAYLLSGAFFAWRAKCQFRRHIF
ncbi:MAG: ABC transporter permease subunit [Sedimentisphaerales bacterium]|nr:ABC transporter permease subunit [Sedimentisphaerales bacterium]